MEEKSILVTGGASIIRNHLVDNFWLELVALTSSKKYRTMETPISCGERTVSSKVYNINKTLMVVYSELNALRAVGKNYLQSQYYNGNLSKNQLPSLR